MYEDMFIQPGTLTTMRYRMRLLMRLYAVGGCSPWVRLALQGRLPTCVVGGMRI